MFVWLVAQHAACTWAMGSMDSGKVKPRKFGNEYERQLTHFWGMDEAQVRSMFAATAEDLDADPWDTFCVARMLFHAANSAVQLHKGAVT